MDSHDEWSPSPGLIHANHGRLIMDYLSQELQRANQNEVVS